MMLRRLNCMLFMLFAFVANAGVVDSLEVAALRELACEQYPEYKEKLMEVFELHNAFPTKDKMLLQHYDSVLRDSVFMGAAAFRAVGIDRVLWNMMKGNAAGNFSALKIAYGDVQMPEGLSAYHQELTSVLLEMALEAEDYATAYRMQNAVHAGAYSEWTTERTALLDSVQAHDALHRKELDTLSAAQQKREREHAQQLLLVYGILGVLVLGCGVLIFVAQRNRKRFNHVKQKAEDNSEKEELVHKLESVRRELNELKVAARKHVEPVVVTQSATSAAPIDLTALNEEIQQGLAKIKAHCETGKQGMSVPTYMSIVNDTTRLSSAVLKRIQSLPSSNNPTTNEQ